MGTVRLVHGTVRYGHGYGTVGTWVWYSKYMCMVLGCRCMGTSWWDQNVGSGQSKYMGRVWYWVQVYGHVMVGPKCWVGTRYRTAGPSMIRSIYAGNAV